MLRKIVILNILITQMFVTGFCFSEKDLSAIEMSKYGKVYISQTQSYKPQVTQTRMEKYGVPFITQAPEVIRKMRKSL